MALCSSSQTSENFRIVETVELLTLLRCEDDLSGPILEFFAASFELFVMLLGLWPSALGICLVDG